MTTCINNEASVGAAPFEQTAIAEKFVRSVPARAMVLEPRLQFRRSLVNWFPDHDMRSMNLHVPRPTRREIL